MAGILAWDMVLLKSTDLTIEPHSLINTTEKHISDRGEAETCLAPQTVFDRKPESTMVYWSMKYGDGLDVIYYAYANNFTDLEGEP